MTVVIIPTPSIMNSPESILAGPPFQLMTINTAGASRRRNSILEHGIRLDSGCADDERPDAPDSIRRTTRYDKTTGVG